MLHKIKFFKKKWHSIIMIFFVSGGCSSIRGKQSDKGWEGKRIRE